MLAVNTEAHIILKRWDGIYGLKRCIVHIKPAVTKHPDTKSFRHKATSTVNNCQLESLVSCHALKIRLV